VSYDFTNNVAIEDAHDGKGQCNMGGEGGECRADSLQSTANSPELWTVDCRLGVGAGILRARNRKTMAGVAGK
jgi:hypothetical protein